MGSRLFDRLVAAGLLVTCLLASALIVVRLRQEFSVGASAAMPPMPFKVGQTLPGLDRSVFDRSDRTLLMLVQSTCQYCTASMPFYEKVAGLPKRGSAFRLVAVTGDERGVSQRYLQGNKVMVDEIVTRPSSMGAVPTPTLVLLDRQGKVRNIWVGQLPPATEEEVTSQLTKS